MSESNENLRSDELRKIGMSFVRFSRRNNSWGYLFLIMFVLFGTVYLFNLMNNRTKAPLEAYREEFVQLKERIEEQDQKIQQLEAEIQKLQTSAE